MPRKTNRLLMLLISSALAACSSQSERGSTGLETQQQTTPRAEATFEPPAPAPEPAPLPQPPDVQFIEAPLPETPPPVAVAPEPEPAPELAPEPTPEPLPDFPITTYELPPEPEVGDLGPIGDAGDTLSYAEAQTPAVEPGISEPMVFPEEEVEDLGPVGDTGDTLSYAEAQTPVQQPGVGAATVFPEEEEHVVEDLGPVGDFDEQLKFAEDAGARTPETVSNPTFPVDEMVTVSFDAEPLFNFDKSNIRSDQRQKLDNLVKSLRDTEYETLTAVGHADRIGTVDYNQKLSERRANSVRAYLVRLGVPAGKINTEGRSKHEPVTTEEECQGKKGNALISCYQPDRRVVVTVSGQKKMQ